MTKFTWLVTDCSSGLGEQLVYAILAQGDNVVATARNGTGRLKDLQESGTSVFDFDVTAPQAAIDAKMNEMLQFYGGVDVLVNNAGYIEAGIV